MQAFPVAYLFLKGMWKRKGLPVQGHGGHCCTGSKEGERRFACNSADQSSQEQIAAAEWAVDFPMGCSHYRAKEPILL